MSLIIRNEGPDDWASIGKIDREAFGGSAEADLVDRLRERGKLLVSLVARDGNETIGHIAFSRVFLQTGRSGFGAGLGPMAVLPGRQNQGIGSRLVAAGIEACRAIGLEFIVVLGHPRFYPRFGFEPASRYGIRCEWDVPDEVFIAVFKCSRPYSRSG